MRQDNEKTFRTARYSRLGYEPTGHGIKILTASIARSFLALARRAFRSCAFTS